MATSGLWNINRPQPRAQDSSYIPQFLVGYGLTTRVAL